MSENEEFEILVSDPGYDVVDEHSQCALVCFDFNDIVEKYVK